VVREAVLKPPVCHLKNWHNPLDPDWVWWYSKGVVREAVLKET